MDQNTNNSFTSAPQGGDYSDIIIPNAYATKPQNKNLKKYIVFGLVGLLFVFLLSFLFKKTVIDSKNMSKEELTTFYESDDMEKINNLEKLFFNTYNNNLTFEMVFDESKSQSIKESKGSLEKLKNLLTVKKNFDGNEASRKIFSELKKKLDERYNPYINAIAVYEDFYQAFQSNDIDTISKYSALWMKYPRRRYRYAEWYLIDIILNIIGGVFLCIYLTLQSVSILAWTKTDKIGLLLFIIFLIPVISKFCENKVCNSLSKYYKTYKSLNKNVKCLYMILSLCTWLLSLILFIVSIIISLATL